MKSCCNKDCFNCLYPDCIRDEREDQRECSRRYYANNRSLVRKRQKDRYYSNLEESREYFSQKAKESYDCDKNTLNCRKYRAKNPEKKKQYDRERYLRKKAEIWADRMEVKDE